MAAAPGQPLLEALLDSWDRNNAILLNLLRALPEGGLEARGREAGLQRKWVQRRARWDARVRSREENHPIPA